MIIAETAAAVLIALDIMIWVPLALRWLRVPSVRVLPHPGRHVSAERVHCGGRYLGTMPRRDAVPLTEQEIVRVHVPGCPWTGEQPVLTDAATLALYRGDYGTTSVADVLEGERLAAVMLP